MTNKPDTISEELLPCPFCGSPAEMEWWHGGGPDKQMISCSSLVCEACPSVTGETPAEAIANWNTRAPLALEGLAARSGGVVKGWIETEDDGVSEKHSIAPLSTIEPVTTEGEAKDASLIAMKLVNKYGLVGGQAAKLALDIRDAITSYAPSVEQGVTITDEMVDAAIAKVRELDHFIVNRRPMRAALEAALSHTKGAGG